MRVARLRERSRRARRPGPFTLYAVSLTALPLCLVALGVPVSAQAAPTAHGTRVAMVVTSTLDHGHGSGAKHTEGSLAVAFSVLGLLVVGGLLLLLAGQSVKRRTREKPRDGDQRAAGPPGRDGGRFL